MITTHYANLKYYASNTEGIANGAMMFDKIALALHHWVVDGRAVQRQPPADIGVDVPQLAEGCLLYTSRCV